MKTEKKSALGSIYLVVFLDMLGFGLLIPIIRDLTEELALKSMLDNDPEVLAGILMASYSLAQFLFTPLLGRISDMRGRKPILILSIAGNVMSYFLWIISSSYLVFLVSRIVSGVTGANISVAQSYIADVKKGKERAKAMGMMGAMLGTGFVIGPYIGGLASRVAPEQLPLIGGLAGNSFAAVGLLAMLLSAINLVWVIVRLRETHGEGREKTRRTINLLDIGRAFLQKNTGRILVISFFFQAGFVFLESVLAWDLQNRYYMDAKRTGDFFAFLGIVMILVQGGVYRRIVDKVATNKIVLYGTVFAFASMIWLAVSMNFWFFAVGIVLFALGMGLGNPSLTTIMSFYSGKDDQGENLGLMQSLGAATRFIVPVLATSIYVIHSMAPYYIAALTFLTAFVMTLSLRAPAAESV